MLVNLAATHKIKEAATREVLQSYVRSVEKYINAHSGDLVWLCGTEVWCRFETIKDAYVSALSIVSHLQRCMPEAEAIVALSHGEVIGMTISRVGQHCRTAYVAICPMVEKCRDMFEYAVRLPCPLLCDENVASALPAEACIPATTGTTRLGLKPVLLNTDMHSTAAFTGTNRTELETAAM